MSSRLIFRTYVFSFSRIVFSLSLVVVFFSLIPSFYPVYKSLIAPSLPSWIQQFFSDIKTLFLTLFGYYLSGNSFEEIADVLSDSSSVNTVKISLQDWIYSYILHCNLYHSALTFRWFCSKCTSLSTLEMWKLGVVEDMCVDCDLCLVDAKDHSNVRVSFFKDDGCSELMNDIIHIVHNGSSDYTSASTKEILMDCFATFILYLRFSIHLLTRTGVRFIINCSRALRSLGMVLRWIFVDIVDNVETNPSRSVALSCVVILCFVVALCLLRVSLRFLKMFIDDIVSVISGPSKVHTEVKAEPQHKVGGAAKKAKNADTESNLSFNRASVIETQSYERSPVWLSLDADPTYKGNGKSVTENWTTILNQNEAIAQLMMQCNDADEDVDCLLHLIEQLHAGSCVGVS